MSKDPGRSYNPGEDIGEEVDDQDLEEAAEDRGFHEHPRGLAGVEPSPDQVLRGRTGYDTAGPYQERSSSSSRPSIGGMAITGHGDRLGGRTGAEEHNPDESGDAG
jgi:hypothetical protein